MSLNFYQSLEFGLRQRMPSDFGGQISLTFWASLVTQSVKNLLAMQEIQVQSLGWENFLEKEVGSHFSILAWKIPWIEDPGRLWSMGSQESDKTQQLNYHQPICLPCRSCRRRGFNTWVGTIPWRRKWEPTPVFLPEKSHEQRNLVGHSPRVAESWT